MQIHFGGILLLTFTLAASAAEHSFRFGGYPLDKTPPGFRSVVAGDSKPGDWRVVEDEAPSAMQKLTPDAPVTSRNSVLAQLAKDPTDEHFPLLVYDGDTYADFTLTTRFKLVSGAVEQMAGVAFRVQDERNFYVIRASGLGNNLRFYKMVDGVRSKPIGPDVEITKGAWHELKIQCEGNQIRCWLDGKDLIPPLTDNSFFAGKLGFWTKSDAVTYFGDTELVYKPREPFAQVMIRDLTREFPRLRGIQIYAPVAGSDSLKVIASSNAADVGKTGTPIEENCFKHDAIYKAKAEGSVTVVMPLRDRNGDNVAAVHLVMESFTGQTEQSILARALPLMKTMQARIQTAKDLTE